MTARGVFLLLVATFVVVLGAAWVTLPPRVPIHFDLAGRPDRVVGRERAVLEFGLVGLALAALLGGLAATVRWLPLSLFNVPHKSYWSRPENEPRLRSLAARDAWVLAGLTMGLLVTLAAVIIVAAIQAAPRLGGVALLLVAAFVVAILGYSSRSRRRYEPEADT